MITQTQLMEIFKSNEERFQNLQTQIHRLTERVTNLEDVNSRFYDMETPRNTYPAEAGYGEKMQASRTGQIGGALSRDLG